jgi:glycerol-3-phosphate O-acyltransferase
MVLTRFLLRSLWLRLRGRWYRYGYACVGFGRPLSLREHLGERGIDLRALSSEQRHAEIEILGGRLMSEVGRVVPVLPVSLVATAVLASGEQGLSSLELKGAVHDLMQRLRSAGAHVHIPRQDKEYAVDVGLRMLVLRRIVTQDGGVYRASPHERALLAYYANAIAHLCASPGQSVAKPASESRQARAE